MNKKYLAISLILGFFISLLALQGISQYNPYNSVILVCFDGTQTSAINELDLPNVQKLRDEGVFKYVYITGHDSDTDAGHAEMLTGYGPSVTGVMRNSFNIIPDNLTIHEKLKNYGFATGFTTGRKGDWRDVDGQETINGCTWDASKYQGHGFADVTFANSQYDVDYWFSPRGIIGENDPGVVPISHGYEIYASTVADKADEFINIYGDIRFFLFVHFADPDLNGHIYGGATENYTQAVIDCDAALGKILATLEQKGIYESTAVIVTTDHSFPYTTFCGSSHGGMCPEPSECCNIWMIINKLVTIPNTYLDGITLGDIAPLVYDLLDVPSPFDDTIPPAITNTQHTPVNPVQGDTLTASTTVIDNVDQGDNLNVNLYYSLDDINWRTIPMNYVGDNNFAVTRENVPSVTFHYYITASDLSGNIAVDDNNGNYYECIITSI